MVRHFRPRAYAAVVGAVALTMLAAACSSSSTSGSGSSSTGPQALTAGFQALNPGSGAPQRGGTLNMIGVSDVNYMDYDIAYYSTDYQVMRMTVRQLYSWPAVPGHTTTPAPDLATAMPVVSDNGLKQTVTIRSGVMWNTSPPRPVTAADVVRGIKRACNPSPVSFGGMADFEATIKGLTAFCAGYPAAAASNAAAMKKYIEGHNVSGITTSGNTITFTLTRPAPWLVGAMTLRAVQRDADRGRERPARHPGGVQPHVLRRALPDHRRTRRRRAFTFARNPHVEGEHRPAAQGLRGRDQRGRDRQPDHDLPADAHRLGVAGDDLGLAGAARR